MSYWTPPKSHAELAAIDSALEARRAGMLREMEAHSVAEATKQGPYAEIDRLRKEIDRLRGCLGQVQQLVYDLRSQLAAAIEKPVRKACKASERVIERRRKTS